MQEIKGIARDPNDQIRKNLSGDQPKLFEPWIALSDEPSG